MLTVFYWRTVLLIMLSTCLIFELIIPSDKSLVKTVSGSIEQRIRKLENHAGGKYPYVIFVNYEGEPELTEAQKEAALADYKTRNHDWEESRIIVLYPEDVEFRE